VVFLGIWLTKNCCTSGVSGSANVPNIEVQTACKNKASD
jgi:hypothetical protein